MPYAPIPSGQLYYEEFGQGPAIIATHGFSECATYWSAGGVADALARKFRFVAMDMRGHGLTRVASDAPGFNVETMAHDIALLADHLGLQNYHLLGHATGSVVALRHAMSGDKRLSSLAVTSAASATAMISPDLDENIKFFGNLALFYRDNDWDAIMTWIRSKPWPFLHRLDLHADRDHLWGKIEDIFRRNDPATLATFLTSFYTDPDTMVDALRAIKCPTLVVAAEHDDWMQKPSAVIAQNVPNAKLIELPGLGHMTALEAPQAIIDAVLAFLEEVETARR